MSDIKTIIKNIITLAQKKAKPGDKIPIAKYANEESFHRLRPFDSLTYEQHNQIVEEAIIALNAAGFCASPIIIDEKKYRQWLGDELNTEQSRAKFITTQLEI